MFGHQQQEIDMEHLNPDALLYWTIAASTITGGCALAGAVMIWLRWEVSTLMKKGHQPAPLPHSEFQQSTCDQQRMWWRVKMAASVR
jgi:hypothetical protein